MFVFDYNRISIFWGCCKSNSLRINRKSLISNDSTAAKTCNDSQSEGKKKDNKWVFIVGDSIVKHLNRYVIGGKTGNSPANISTSDQRYFNVGINVEITLI